MFFRPPPEPEYGGKKLREWVVIYKRGQSEAGDPAEAIGHFGTNAVPYLVKWLTFEQSPPWKRRLHRGVNPILMRLNSSWRFSDDNGIKRSLGAYFALIDLGSEAEGAIQDLSRLANNAKAPETQLRAIGVLGGLGTAGLTALVGVLTNHYREGCRWTPGDATIAHYLMRDRPLEPQIVRLAVPALLSMLTNPNPIIKDAATDALQIIDPQVLDKVGAQKR